MSTSELGYGAISTVLEGEPTWQFITRRDDNDSTVVVSDASADGGSLTLEGGRCSPKRRASDIRANSVRLDVTLRSPRDIRIARGLKGRTFELAWWWFEPPGGGPTGEAGATAPTSYRRVATLYRGQVVSAVLRSNYTVVSIELVAKVYPNQPEPVEWSSSFQMRRSPSDRGLEYVDLYSDVERVFGWPLSIGARQIRDQRLLTSQSSYAFGVPPNRPTPTLQVLAATVTTNVSPIVEAPSNEETTFTQGDSAADATYSYRVYDPDGDTLAVISTWVTYGLYAHLRSDYRANYCPCYCGHRR